MTPEAKEILLDLFQDDFKRLDKHINYVSFDQRFKELKPYMRLICTGNDQTAIDARKLMFESLKGEFSKLPMYMRQLPLDKRAVEGRQYLQMLGPKQMEQIFGSMKRN